MYLGQLPYKAIIRKKKKNNIPTDSKGMPEIMPKKRLKQFKTREAINKMT